MQWKSVGRRRQGRVSLRAEGFELLQSFAYSWDSFAWCFFVCRTCACLLCVCVFAYGCEHVCMEARCRH